MCAVLLSMLVACSGGPADPDPDPAPSVTPDEPVTSAPPRDLVDVAALPLGAPPRVAYLGGGVVHHDGRTVETDFPDAACCPTLMGTYQGRLLVSAYDVDGPGEGPNRFYAIDGSGRTERLGEGYQVYDYAPVLVADTGHIWVHYSDRGTGRRVIWVLDAATGDEVAVYRDADRPTGLAPADQALYDAWVADGGASSAAGVVSPYSAVSPDGSVRADLRSAPGGRGRGTTTVVLRRTGGDRAVLQRFRFAGGNRGPQSILFEDDRAVLVLDTVEIAHGRSRQAVVRCGVDGRCERATDVVGEIALGIAADPS